jgi:hypothetical protein
VLLIPAHSICWFSPVDVLPVGGPIAGVTPASGSSIHCG